MPIQLIDNFELNTAKPLDNRMVVGPDFFYNTKEDIPSINRYEGLRIWDTNDSSPYVWDGSGFIPEAPGIGGSGTIGYIPVFNDVESVTNSNIRFTNNSIGIGAAPDDNFTLSVNGAVKASSYEGIGINISNINATNITTGSLNPLRIGGGTGGAIQVLINNQSNITEWIQSFDFISGSTDKVKVSPTTTTNFKPLLLGNSYATIPSYLSVNDNVHILANTADGRVISRGFSITNPGQNALANGRLTTILSENNTAHRDIKIPTLYNSLGKFLIDNLDQEINSTKTFTENTFFTENVTIGSTSTSYTITTSGTSQILSEGYEDGLDFQGPWIAQGIASTSSVSKLLVDGYIKASGIFFTSDERNKNEILRPKNETLLDKVLKLEPVLYQLKDTGFIEMGLIAQEVEKVIPEAVVKVTSENNEEGEYNLNYSIIFTHLIGAIKELNKEIESIKGKL